MKRNILIILSIMILVIMRNTTVNANELVELQAGVSKILEIEITLEETDLEVSAGVQKVLDEVSYKSYEFINVDYQRYVKNTTLNVRSVPSSSLDDTVIGKLVPGTCVSVIKEIKDSPWLQIKFKDSIGYIHSDYIQEEWNEYATYNYTWEGEVLNSKNGVVNGPSGLESYYNLDMSKIISIMPSYTDGYYWVRSDGVKMFGQYVMVAADLNKHPRGSIVETSLGDGIVCDTGAFVHNGSGKALDIAVAW